LSTIRIRLTDSIRPRPRLSTAVAYLLLAIVSTWPLARHSLNSLPVGTESCATVPLFNLWTLGWNVGHLGELGRGYWDAPIFHPTTRAFAFSEPMCIAGVIAAPVWWLASPAAAYNFVLILALTLNGWTTCQFLKGLRLRWLAAFAGGAMAVFLPFVHWQLGVIQLVPLCGLVWTLHSMLRFSQQPRIATGLLLGLAIATTYLLCTHYGLFLCVLLVLCGGPVLIPICLRWRMWVGLIAGAVLACLLVLPEVTVQLFTAKEHEFIRSRQQVENLSAEPSYYTATPWPELIPLPDLRERAGKLWMLSPGSTKYCLAALGLAVGLWHRRRRSFTAMCAIMLVLSVDLSFGPKLEFYHWHPYEWLHDYVPGYAQVRNIFRYAAIAQLLVVILAAIGLHGLLTLGRRNDGPASSSPGGSGWPRLGISHACRPALRNAFVALLGFIAVSEVRPPPQKLHEAPSYERNYHWVTWLKNATPPDTVLAHLPFPQGSFAEHYQPTTVVMNCQLWHRRPMVNGYSGFFPEEFIELKHAVNELPGKVHGLDMLRQHGVRYCVVDRSWLTREQFEGTPAYRGQLEWVIGDEQAGIDVYELVPRPGQAR